MRNVLGQLDARQSLADIDGLVRLLWQVPNGELRKQLEGMAAECRVLLERAMAEDVDVQPGIDCVDRLYEAFEEAKRAPAVTPAARRAGEVAGSSATILWIVAAGAATIGIVSAIVK